MQKEKTFGREIWIKIILMISVFLSYIHSLLVFVLAVIRCIQFLIRCDLYILSFISFLVSAWFFFLFFEFVLKKYISICLHRLRIHNFKNDWERFVCHLFHFFVHFSSSFLLSVSIKHSLVQQWIVHIESSHTFNVITRRMNWKIYLTEWNPTRKWLS